MWRSARSSGLFGRYPILTSPRLLLIGLSLFLFYFLFFSDSSTPRSDSTHITSTPPTTIPPPKLKQTTKLDDDIGDETSNIEINVPAPKKDSKVEEASTTEVDPNLPPCRKVDLPPPDRNKRRIFAIVMFSCSPEARKVIPHFMDHYLNRIGIKPEHMLVTIHTSSLQSNDYKSTKELVESYGAIKLSSTTNEYTAKENYRTLFAWYQSPEVQFTTHDWILPLDMDEFQVWPKPLPEILDESDKNGFTFIKGNWVDRISSDGSFPLTAESPSIWKQFSLDCSLKLITKAKYFKVVAHRAFLTTDPGHHSITFSNKVSFLGGNLRDQLPPSLVQLNKTLAIPVYHFKWTANVIPSLEQRVETYKRLKAWWYVQSEDFLKHIKEHDGKLCLDCPEVACKPGFDPDLHPPTFNPFPKPYIWVELKSSIQCKE